MTVAALEIVGALAPAWVQDRGRPGRMGGGLPPGGAWVPERLVAANRAVGNPGGAAAVEAFGGLVVAARGGDLRVAWGGAAAEWLPRDRVRVLAPPPGRGAYLAVAGGIDVPIVLGGRGLLASAGLGGGVGRPLRAGDRLSVGSESAHAEAPRRFDPPPDAPIRVVRGPDPGRFVPGAWEGFLAAEWRVDAAFDRVGARLGEAPQEPGPRGSGPPGSGPAVRRVDGDAALSAPMVRGAIQVPVGGAPIVLGPDHPITGGYPLIAVVIRADLGALAVRETGAPVRFVEVDLAEARAAAAAWRALWEEDPAIARASATE